MRSTPQKFGRRHYCIFEPRIWALGYALKEQNIRQAFYAEKIQEAHKKINKYSKVSIMTNSVKLKTSKNK